MISNAIVISALVLAGGYCLLWLLGKDFRQQVEQPKYRFLQQVNQFDGRHEESGVKEDKVNGQP